MLRKGLCVLFLVFIPLLLAQGYIRKSIDKKYVSLCMTYNQGCNYMLIGLTLLFELCRFAQWGLTVYVWMFALYTIIISILGQFIGFRNKREKKHLNNLHVINIKFLFALFCLIAFQMLAYLFTGSFNQDDYSVEIVNTISANDSFFYVSPYTGETGTNILSLYTPMMMFYAFLSKISNLHPTLLIHVIVPFWILIWFSSICYEYGLELFENRRKAACLVLGIQVLNILGTHGRWLTSSLLLFEAWKGESILLLCLFPQLILKMIRMFQAKVKVRDWLLLILQSVMIILFEKSGILYIGLLLFVTLIFVSGRKIYEFYKSL